MHIPPYLATRTRGLTLALAIIAADAASKTWALSAAANGDLPISLHPYVATLVLAFNRGMSFSLFNDTTYGALGLGILAVVASAWFIHWMGENRRYLHQLGLGAIVGGAIGNLIDRLQHGAVVDFFMPVWAGKPYFPIFNVADACITLGVVLLLADWFISGRTKA